ncbi:MAG: class I SAM-dependent methyltransferase [Bacilli bacterium]|nr:class I SAM-dependent methyltransferase [Bacilli bacterium]
MKVNLTEEAKQLLQQLLETMDENIEKADYYNQILSEGFLVDKDSSYLPISELRAEDYFDNPYLKNVRPQNVKIGKWSLESDKYIPNQPFSYDAIKTSAEDGYREETRFGYFTRKFKFPAIKENGTTWMSITPHEINTMKQAINEAHGNVLVLGLGLGYYPYMISLKDNVSSIDVVEIAKEPFNMFKANILPQFKNKDKIHLFLIDAFLYLKNNDKQYDYIFVDLWHLPEDGLPLYTKTRRLEQPNSRYSYWIETDILIRLRRAVLILLDELSNNPNSCFEKGNDLTEDLLFEINSATQKLVVANEEDIMKIIDDSYLKELAKSINI